MKLNFLLPALCFACFACEPPTEKGKETTKSEKNANEKAQSESQKPELWKYEESIDEMSNEKSYFASVPSTNKVEFEFPYQGGSTFTFAIRNMKGANDAFMIVSKGQFMPSIMGSEHIRVKFDNDEPIDMNYEASRDTKVNAIFFKADFLDRLKKAKKLMIEAPFFNAGRQIARFDVEGLKWDK